MQKLHNSVNNYVKCIVNHITREVPRKFQPKYWEVVVFKDKSTNAFALPGGKIGVYTEFLKVAKN